MSMFEPKCMHTLCVNLLNARQHTRFVEEWNNNVVSRWRGWKRGRKNQPQVLAQLEWEAHICEYVNFLSKQMHSLESGTLSTPLSTSIPILGPCFVLPTYLHLQKRAVSPEVVPETTYLKPIHVVHPFYYPQLNHGCPQCGLDQVSWNSHQEKPHFPIIIIWS
ncbi:hypothetical protein C8Q70DRAFT_920675 [Cubamyces menziesii]|nr:hypothetical protein C8Q70DRAFT_920675 [Cubamyces menziesii]